MNLLNDKVFIGKTPPRSRNKNIILIDCSGLNPVVKRLENKKWVQIGNYIEDNNMCYLIYIELTHDSKRDLMFSVHRTKDSYPNIEFVGYVLEGRFFPLNDVFKKKDIEYIFVSGKIFPEYFVFELNENTHNVSAEQFGKLSDFMIEVSLDCSEYYMYYTRE